MDLKKPDRSTLKSYFVRNALPTASHFADLIESQINQRDDGIAKPAGEPLSLQAEGDDTSQKKTLNFYASFSDPNPAWTLSLNPRADPTNAKSARPGWSIGDAEGRSRLFIDKNTGNVGIGTAEPGDATLRVAGSLKAASNASGEREIAMEAPAGGNHRGSGTQGATGLVYRALKNPLAGEPIFQVRSEQQAVRFFVEHDGWTGSQHNSAWFGGTRINYFAGNVGIGVAEPLSKLEVFGAVNISNGMRAAIGRMAAGSLTVGGTNANYGGGKGWDKNNNVAALLLETASNTEIAVHDASTRLASLMYYEGDTANRITIGRDMGSGGPIGRVVVASDLEVAGAVYARSSHPMWHRMYPSEPLVYQSIFDAQKDGKIRKIGSPSYSDDSYYAPGVRDWYGRNIIAYGGNSEADGHGAEVSIPDGYETVWVRVLGDRYAVFRASYTDGAKEDLGFWAGGYRSSNGYCPDGSLSDGFNDATHELEDKAKIRVELHQWVPIPVPRSGKLALVSKPGTNWAFWLSGLAFSRNPWKHATQHAVVYHWKLNGSAQMRWAGYDWNQDVIAEFTGGTDWEVVVPVVPSKRDKLLFLVEHNNTWNGAAHAGITVWGHAIERFLSTYDNPFARHWNGKPYQRYLAARIPAGLVGDNRYLRVRIDMRNRNTAHGTGLHFREIGTHDLELPPAG
jgi:hypothetical protein